jgi:hypothetical protein
MKPFDTASPIPEVTGKEKVTRGSGVKRRGRGDDVVRAKGEDNEARRSAGCVDFTEVDRRARTRTRRRGCCSRLSCCDGARARARTRTRPRRW